MKVMVLSNGELSEREIDGNNTCRELQQIVGGLIDIPFLSEDFEEAGIDIVINDEGKLLDLDIELIIANERGRLLDVICGNVVFTGHDDEGNTVGLANYQVNMIKNGLGTFMATLKDGRTCPALII